MSIPHTLGPVMFDLAGIELAPADRDKLLCPAAGGIILFARNYLNPEQISRLTLEIRDIRPDLLIAVDQEGGRVQRFREGFTRLPSASRYQVEPDAEGLAETAGWLMAAELRAVGVDLSFAPVLDVECGISQVIGDRAFGDDPESAIRLAGSFVRGMQRAGMAAVGKHFPGHGSVVEDSHVALPVDRRPLADIEARDLRPFRALIEEGLDGIMASHVIYEQLDDRPAGFSPFWIREVLRQRLGFRGAVFTDDLSMAGAAYAGGPVDRARLALEAGCDMVLVCNAPGAAEAVLEDLASRSFDPASAGRIQRMRGGVGVDRPSLLAGAEWQDASARITALT